MGWLIGLAVLLITVGVIAGLIGIAVVAKRKQKYRIHDPTESRPTNSAGALDRHQTLTFSSGALPPISRTVPASGWV